MALEVSLRACRSRVKGFQTRYKPSPALRASARKVWVPWIEDPRLRKLQRLRKEMRPCSDPEGGMIQGPSKGEGPSKGGLEIREGAGYENKGVIRFCNGGFFQEAALVVRFGSGGVL
jgi:hypothetical protein